MDGMSGWGMMGVGIAVGVGLSALKGRFCGKRRLQEERLATPCNTEVIFFPDKRLEWGGGDEGGGGMKRVLSTLSQAEKSLDLALFSFSNRRLAREVIGCMNRGVKVRLVTEITMMDQPGGQVKRMKEAGVCIVASQREGLMHHKFAIVDSTILLNGSFNWTERAVSENCENVVISREGTLVDEFLKEFEKMFAADRCLCPL